MEEEKTAVGADALNRGELITFRTEEEARFNRYSKRLDYGRCLSYFHSLSLSFGIGGKRNYPKR